MRLDLLTSAGRLELKRLTNIARATGSYGSAQRELRWIKSALANSGRITAACKQRGAHYPLQYILGTQPFGHLEIICKPGVLIPRWETEEWASKLGSVLSKKQGLCIVDFCTGTGCIPLLLSQFVVASQLYGIDVSSKAVDLFNVNLQHNSPIANSNNIKPVQADIFSNSIHLETGNQQCDLITANPPYIPVADYHKNTERSVRNFEPSLALVGNLEFYEAIIRQASYLNSKALVCEVGYQHQIDYCLAQIGHDGWINGFGLRDSAGKPRVVVIYKSGWSFLEGMKQ